MGLSVSDHEKRKAKHRRNAEKRDEEKQASEHCSPYGYHSPPHPADTNGVLSNASSPASRTRSARHCSAQARRAKLGGICISTNEISKRERRREREGREGEE
jgi:hypothetical protein